MPRKPSKRNDGSKTKPKDTPSLKKAVGNSKTSAKKKVPTSPKPAKTAISSDKGAKNSSVSPVPKPSEGATGGSSGGSASLSPSKKRSILEILASGANITGSFEEPQFRKREQDYACTIAVEKSKKPLAIKLQQQFNSGDHVVAIILPLKDVRDWPAWEAFDTGEILRVDRGSDFERPFEVTTAYMADVLDMSARNLQLLHQKKHAKKFGRGRWDMVATVKAYLKYIKDEYQGRGGKEYSEERTKDKREQRLMRELDRRQKAEQLVDAEECKSAAFEMGVKYRKAVENLIPRVSPQLVHAKSQAKVRAILKPEIDQILTSLALNQDPKPKRKKSAGSSRKRK